MSKRIRLGVAVVLLGGVVAGIAVVARPKTSVDVAVVERRDISTYIEEPAKTRLPKIHRITMPLDGRVLPIEYAAGDSVKKGDIVARLESTEWATAVAEAEARVTRLEKRILENDDTRLELNALEQFDKFLDSMNDTVRSAAEQTTASKAKVAFADSESDRLEKLTGTNASTKRELAEAKLLQKESQVDYAKDMLTLSSMESLRSAMRIGRESINKYIEKKSLQRAVLDQELEEARLQLSRAKRDLDRTQIPADVSGTVLHRHISNKRMLPAGEVLLEIGEMTELEIEAEILSEDAVVMRPGFTAEITGPSIGPEPIPAVITKIEPQGFTKVSSLGVEQQRVRVILGFPSGTLESLEKRGRVLGADYRIRVRIFTAQKSNALVIPRSALFRSPKGSWQVFVVRDERVESVDVEVGLANDFHAEIRSGVDEGDAVVIAPDASLQEGTRVSAQTITAIRSE